MQGGERLYHPLFYGGKAMDVKKSLLQKLLFYRYCWYFQQKNKFIVYKFKMLAKPFPSNKILRYATFYQLLK